MATEVEITCKKVVENVGDSVFFAGVNNPDIGLIRAALSPQNSRILNALYPERDNGTVSYKKVSGVTYPVVTVQWRNKAAANDIEISPTCSAPSGMATKVEEDVIINKYAQDGFQLTEVDMNMLCDEYNRMNGNFASTRSVQSPVGGIFKNTIDGELVDRLENILQKVDTDLATALVAGVGVNKLYRNNDAQLVKLFNTDDAQQGPVRFFKTELDNLKRKNKMRGNPIIITNSYDVLNWFEVVCGMSCCSDAGLDYSRMVNQPYEVYFSDKITSLLDGDDDEIVVVYPESFLLLSVDKWRNVQLGAGKSKVAHTQFGKISILEPSIRISDSGCIAEIGVPRTTFDLRMRETDCVDDDAMFSLDFLASMYYNTVTAPADADGVTGIFRYKVDRGIAV